MTKREALAEFRAELLPVVIARYGRDDKVARCEAWNNYTDSLRRDRRITAAQYDRWANPF